MSTSFALARPTMDGWRNLEEGWTQDIHTSICKTDTRSPLNDNAWGRQSVAQALQRTTHPRKETQRTAKLEEGHR